MTESRVPYYHWSSRSDYLQAPFVVCSPNLLSLLTYLKAHWGGQSLGCHNDRSVRGGSTVSTHAWGAALDYEPNGGNNVAVAAVAPFLIKWSAELGINTIHDYVRQRMWKPLQGWVAASIGSQGGQWIHIEVTPAAWGDSRQVETKIAGAPPPPPPPPPFEFNPLWAKWGLYPIIGSGYAPGTVKPSLKLGNRDLTGTNPKAEFVKYLQGVMWHKAGQGRNLPILSFMDGYFGNETLKALRNVQAFCRGGLPKGSQREKDLAFEQYVGVCGPNTWRVIDGLTQH